MYHDKLVADGSFRHTFIATCSAGQHRAAHSFVFNTQRNVLVLTTRINCPTGSNDVTQASPAICHKPPSCSFRRNRNSAVKSCSDSGLKALPLFLVTLSNVSNHKFSWLSAAISSAPSPSLPWRRSGGSVNSSSGSSLALNRFQWLPRHCLQFQCAGTHQTHVQL